MRRPYDSHQWRALRREILKRDRYVCQVCGARADAVDHIIPWREAPMLAFEPENCRAICTPCNSARVSKPHLAGKADRRPSREW